MSIPQRLTEAQIEDIVKRDLAELRKMEEQGKLSPAEYAKEAKRIARWSETAWKRRVFAE